MADHTATILPGVPNAIMARVVEQAGFPAVFLSGAGIANWELGLADYGLVTLTELRDVTARTVSAVTIPVLVDADTGFGGPLNVRRTIQELEQAGAAGITLEDQVSPKRCGHFAGKEVITADDMVQKIRAAVEARTDPDFVIIARTDALAVEDLDAVLERAHRYREAGVDATFIEAPLNREAMQRIGSLPWPQVANMVEGGKTPILGQAELTALGFSLVLYANAIPRAALKAATEAAHSLATNGSSAGIPMVTWDERQNLVRLPELQQLEQRYKSGGGGNDQA
jgi:2-methylisocitrate lyase-like PEP mutase family enzyme